MAMCSPGMLGHGTASTVGQRWGAEPYKPLHIRRFSLLEDSQPGPLALTITL